MNLPLLYTLEPPFSDPTNFRPHTWTGTILGYINEAKQVVSCCAFNRELQGYDYPWKVDLHIASILTIQEHKALWAKACRILNRNQISLLWVREVNRKNRLHYHLTIKSRISLEALKAALEGAMPSRRRVRWHCRIRPIFNSYGWIGYSVKAKVGGVVNGKYVADKYKRKRLLFRPKLGLRKFGTIGQFWEPGWTKAKIWKAVGAREEKIHQALQDPAMRLMVQHLEDMLGLPLRQLERSVGLCAEDFRVWADQLWAEANKEV